MIHVRAPIAERGNWRVQLTRAIAGDRLLPAS